MAPLRHMDNNNPKADIEKLKRDVMENLRELAHTPSQQSACSKIGLTCSSSIKFWGVRAPCPFPKFCLSCASSMKYFGM